MRSREHSSVVLALAALVACASARPDDAVGFYGKRSYNSASFNPIKDGSAPAKNAVQTVSVNPVGHLSDNKIPLQPHSEQEPSPVNVAPVSQAQGGQPVIAPNAKTDEIPALFRDDSRAVNKRYPHAVLFGGTCGGTIIGDKWILTAGHCTLFTGGRYVLAGTNNSDDGSGVTKKVKKLYVHPLFSVGPYWLNARNFDIKQVAARWDFMLAELEEPFQLDGEIIAAAPLDDGSSPTQPGTYVGYAGYGTDHHGGYMRSAMHAMHLKVQSDEVCAKLEQFVSKDMLCARGYAPNFDSACNGDSGSGLVDKEKLVGVASWVENDAFECANGNIVYFSKVSSVRKWIHDITGL